MNEGCKALGENKVHLLPYKKGKIKLKHRHFNYLVYLDDNNNTLIEKRNERGIWQNLYQFPLLESEKEINLSEFQNRTDDTNGLPSWDAIHIYNEIPIVHKLSHQHLHTKFWILKKAGSLEGATPWDEIQRFPVPVLLAEFIQRFKI